MEPSGNDLATTVPAATAGDDSLSHSEPYSDPDEPLELQPPAAALDWRTLVRLRLQQEETQKMMTKAQEDLDAAKKLRKRARAERDVLEDATLGYEHLVAQAQPARTHRRTRRPARVPPEGYDDVIDTDEYAKLKTALSGCLNRYHCARSQKRAALFDALQKYPK